MTALQIPATIDDDLFDKNDDMNHVFYYHDYDPDCLMIGGSEWDNYKSSRHVQSDEETMSLESNFLECFSRSKVVRKRMMEDPTSFGHIYFTSFWLHDWKPLFLSLRQHNVTVKVIGFCDSRFTEQGIETLNWLMNPQQSGFTIENFSLRHMRLNNTIGSKLIHGLSGISVKNLNVDIAPSWFLPLFMQQCHVQNFACEAMHMEPGYEDYISLEAEIDRTNVASRVENDNNSINTVNVTLHNQNTEDTSRLVGNLLRSKNVGRLNVNVADLEIHHFDSDDDSVRPEATGDSTSYDIFSDAIHCQYISIKLKSIVESWFPRDGLAALLHQPDGDLECLHVTSALMYSPQRYEYFEKLLEVVDLTNLDTLEIGPIRNSDESFSVLCRHLGENKGLRCLKVTLDQVGQDASGELETLRNVLSNNTKVEQLYIEMFELKTSAPELLKFIQRICCEIPRLSSFEFLIGCRKCDSEYDRQWAEEDMNACLQEIASMMDDERELKMAILRQIGKSTRIKHIRLPFNDEGLGLMMEGIFKCKNLLRCGNDTSDGVWPRALSRNIMTASAMFRVVQQIPRLFQPKTEDQKDDNVQPSFVVPHHPNCPACRRHIEEKAAKRVCNGAGFSN